MLTVRSSCENRLLICEAVREKRILLLPLKLVGYEANLLPRRSFNTHIHTRTRTHIHTHTHIHTYIHTHTYAHTRMLPILLKLLLPFLLPMMRFCVAVDVSAYGFLLIFLFMSVLLLSLRVWKL